MTRCALCGFDRVLIKSHLIPAAAYAHLRRNTNFGMQQSVKINKYEKTAVQTDNQVQQPLLCKDCEDLFSKHGERIVGQLWSTQGGFPLFDMLSLKTPRVKTPKITTFDIDAIDKVFVDGLFYFAISIFWRAEVWSWHRAENPYGNGLGSRYELEFKEFLKFNSGLSNLYLCVEVNSDKDSRGLFSFPSCERLEGSWYHSFVILGMRFVMVVGGGKSKIRDVCEAIGSNMFFSLSDFSESFAFKDMISSARGGVTRRGKFSSLDLDSLVGK